MKKLTEWDKCVLYLAEHGGWVRALEMKGKPFSRGFIGSEADRRMQQVMEDITRDGYYTVEGKQYVIEGRMDGKFKVYRIASEEKVKKLLPQQFFDNKGRPSGVRMVLV